MPHCDAFGCSNRNCKKGHEVHPKPLHRSDTLSSFASSTSSGGPRLTTEQRAMATRRINILKKLDFLGHLVKAKSPEGCQKGDLTLVTQWCKDYIKFKKRQNGNEPIYANVPMYDNIMKQLESVANNIREMIETNQDGVRHIVTAFEPQYLKPQYLPHANSEHLAISKAGHSRGSSTNTLTQARYDENPQHALSHRRRIGLRQAARCEVETSGIFSKHGGWLMA